jgi:fimbrial chaperone protein
MSWRAFYSIAMGVLASSVLGIATAEAASLQVSPIQFNYGASEQSQALYLRNTGNEPLQAQVRVMRWTQVDGQEVLEKATDLIASPAIVRVVPGQRQVVRLARTRPLATVQEKAYRILVDELPRPAPDGRSGLEVLMRYSIPAFVAVPRASASSPAEETDLSHVRARLVPGLDGKTALQVSNDGAEHLRISYASLTDKAGAHTWLAQGLIGYVLPGQQMSWPLAIPLPLPAGHVLQARFNEDRQSRPVPLAEPGR